MPVLSSLYFQASLRHSHVLVLDFLGHPVSLRNSLLLS